MTSLCNLRFCCRRLGRLRLALLVVAGLALPALPAQADTIVAQPYEVLLRLLDRREGFEAWPPRAEPGHLLQAPHRGDAITLASHFAGQTPAILTRRDGGRFDSLTQARALPPLRLDTGPPGQGLAIAQHRGLGSNAVFPVGPDGFERLSGRGEGMLAVLFDHDQRATGFRVHADYPDPLGTRPARRGSLEVIFLDRTGQVLARVVTPLDPGLTTLGYATADGLPAIAGLLILNTDPGGIAVDDILYDAAALLGGMQHSAPQPAQASLQAPTPALLSRHAWKTAQHLPRQP